LLRAAEFIGFRGKCDTAHRFQCPTFSWLLDDVCEKRGG
jgi:hypothetical protein